MIRHYVNYYLLLRFFRLRLKFIREIRQVWQNRFLEVAAEIPATEEEMAVLSEVILDQTKSSTQSLLKNFKKMTNGEISTIDKASTDTQLRERRLKPIISTKLTELRGSDLPFHEKAIRYSEFLKQQGCTDIVRFDCDVCVDAYLPAGKKLSDYIREEAGGKDLASLSEEERDVVIDQVGKRLPEECKVRVQAATAEGYHTYCFDCDATMCENEVEYPDDPDWDELQVKTAEDFLEQHPDLGVDKYKLWGSTRRYICIDVLSEDPDRESDYLVFKLPDGKQIRITYSSTEMINMMGQVEAQFILGLYRKLHTHQ